MLQQAWRNWTPQVGEMRPNRLQIGGVPQDDSASHKVERARPMALRLQRVIADTADPMEEDGAFQCIFRLALVEFAGGATTLFGLLNTIESEQGALDAADLAQCQCKTVGPRIGTEPFQHDQCADDPGADRGSQSQNIVPMRSDKAFIDLACNQRRDIRAGIYTVEQVETAVSADGTPPSGAASISSPGPAALNRNTQSRTVWRPTPPSYAAFTQPNKVGDEQRLRSKCPFRN